MAVTLAKWTLEQYHQIVDSGILADRAVELLHGEIVEMPPEGEPHAYSNTEARDYLIAVLRDRAQIRDSKPITLPSSQSEPQPDLAIVQPLGREYREHHPYPENIFWVIEFSNTSLLKDLYEKAKAYAIAGIQEYWVVDLKRQTMIVLRNPDNETYRLRQEKSEGTICPLAFPEIEIEISRITN
ncbi:Uma2 family endonuclease [Romeria aff. gracilis LEGE 07310]|uniref:Uma2 family endonuclease n=1 Tax=Vasconcelosia minhoensis LEGE 07310 TaxID=915328 RepID=A0A8J7AYQ0_9CYAN|nr:Uma2 family endonuclease [Romeria gracilis]MBE9080313.1 Uma2 family endonuclease [Romeria aff. gracilis LEGE 07310]